MHDLVINDLPKLRLLKDFAITMHGRILASPFHERKVYFYHDLMCSPSVEMFLFHCSYSTTNSVSGINFGATALVGCDNGQV